MCLDSKTLSSFPRDFLGDGKLSAECQGIAPPWPGFILASFLTLIKSLSLGLNGLNHKNERLGYIAPKGPASPNTLFTFALVSVLLPKGRIPS